MKILKSQEKAEKIERYSEKKMNSIDINEVLADYFEKTEKRYVKAEKLRNCASYLLFKRYLDPGNSRKLYAASFCNHPLCVMCEWRLHLKKFRQLDTAVKLMQMADDGYKFYFLTLTVQNWEEITKEKLRELQRKAVEFIRTVLGTKSYYVSTEITIAENGTYHSHIHVILSSEVECDVSYDAISQYRRLWRLIYGHSDYDYLLVTLYPIANNSISEVTKYILKPEKKISRNQIINIAKAIYGLKKTFASGDIRTYMVKAKEGVKNTDMKEIKKLSRYDYYFELFRWAENVYTPSDE